MSNSNSLDKSTSSRVTLKLKVGAQSVARKKSAPAALHVHNKSDLKRGARWSDEYTRRMQADMDAMHRD